MAFVELADGAELSVDELKEAVKDMAAYKRPSHFELLKPGEMPLTRVAKTDYMVPRDSGEKRAEQLRAEGGWDV